MIKVLVAVMMFSSAVFAGNAVNNGGNSLPQDQVSMEELQKAADLAPAYVRIFLNSVFYGAGYQNNDYWEFTPLFKTDISIYDVLENIQIEVKTNGPCIDQDGKEADASAVGSEPSLICLSLQRLHTKLGQDNYKRQIWALMLHEYSHRVGFNEDNAYQLQLNTLKVLRKLGDKFFPEHYQYDFLNKINTYYGMIDLKSIEYVMSNFDQLPNEKLYISNIHNLIPRSPIFFNSEEADELNLLTFRATTAYRVGVCGLSYIPFFATKLNWMCTRKEKQIYAHTFYGQATVDVRSLVKAFDSGYSEVPYYTGPMPIRNIKTREDAKKELIEIYNRTIPLIQKRNKFFKKLIDCKLAGNC